MNVQELYRAGKLQEAIIALSAEVRDNPTDTRRRTFLFELLCFAGEYGRADKQLEVLAQAGPAALTGVIMYRSAIYAQRLREDLFAGGELPLEGEEEPGRECTVNGKLFHSLSDADPRVGARLELFAAGNYLLLAFKHITSIQVSPPKRLRDLLWIPAQVRTAPSFKGAELRDVLLPALSPFSWQHGDDAVRLGRATVWETPAGGEEAVPLGQKMWLADDEEIPFLELRTLEFNPAPVVV